MGLCCSKASHSEDSDNNVSPEPGAYSCLIEETSTHEQTCIDPMIVDDLVRQMLVLLSGSYNDNEESPPALVELCSIADNGDGWIQVVISMINIISLDNPIGPSTITTIFDDCPLPSKDSVKKLSKMLRLSKKRALAENMDVARERNVCIILGCMAEKFAEPNTIAILTDKTLDYLITFLVERTEPNLVLFALIALEKIAHRTENKLRIEKKLNAVAVHPLIHLETMADSDNYLWRQVGFCAKWVLDNLFVIDGRQLSYETIDMSQINAILNTANVSKYFKLAHNGLEARCDTYSFESVRCTFQANDGCWYYECLVVTPGVMQIGWATNNSRFVHHEGFAVGDDDYSLSYDGCRQLFWYRAAAIPCIKLPKWESGDIFGCLLDIQKKQMIFSLNGKCLPPISVVFRIVRKGFFAAASLMAFQHCRFNFGNEPFKFPPTDRAFQSFNDYGILTKEMKMVVPRWLNVVYLDCDKKEIEDACTVCYDGAANRVLEPCNHRGFCSNCTSILYECPLCRSLINNVRDENRDIDSPFTIPIVQMNL